MSLRSTKRKIAEQILQSNGVNSHPESTAPLSQENKRRCSSRLAHRSSLKCQDSKNQTDHRNTQPRSNKKVKSISKNQSSDSSSLSKTSKTAPKRKSSKPNVPSTSLKEEASPSSSDEELLPKLRKKKAPAKLTSTGFKKALQSSGKPKNKRAKLDSDFEDSFSEELTDVSSEDEYKPGPKDKDSEASDIEEDQSKTGSSAKARIKPKGDISRRKSKKTTNPTQRSAPKLPLIDETTFKSISSKLEKSAQGITFDDINAESSSDHEDWEEVPGMQMERMPAIPKEGIEVVVEKEPSKNKFDIESYLRWRINKIKKRRQVVLHQVNILCFIAHGQFVNSVLSTDIIRAVCLSLVEPAVVPAKKNLSIDYLTLLLTWFRKNFHCSNKKEFNTSPLQDKLMTCIQEKQASNSYDYILAFASFSRCLGLDLRLCIAFVPHPLRPKDLLSIKSGQQSQSRKLNETAVKKEDGAKKQPEIKMPQIAPELLAMEGKSSDLPPGFSAAVPPESAEVKVESEENPNQAGCNADSDVYIVSSEDSDSDFEEAKKYRSKKKTSQPRKKSSSKPKNRKILSSDSETEKPTPNKKSIFKYWCEIYLRGRWVCVEPHLNLIDRPAEVEASFPHKPLTYVIAVSATGLLKDVTKRYCSKWMTGAQKLRLNETWWNKRLKHLLIPQTKQSKEEDVQLGKMLKDKPMPTTISEYKDHPLFCLKRHLLWNEAFYPPDPPVLNTVRGEEVYPRENVHKLLRREKWLSQEARVVRPGEKPVKLAKAAFTKNLETGKYERGGHRELFGRWQTDPYEPPVACDGVVPRNEYGNVELFRPEMLPVGTVYLQLPGLLRIAKKLDIDCAPAVVGFELAKMSMRPVLDGWVVCQEYAQILREAWVEEQENMARRARERSKKRAKANWKRLYKLFLLRKRITQKYRKN